MTNAISKTALIVPLTQSTVGEIRSAMHQSAEAGADMVEFRLDYLANPPEETDLKTLLEGKPLPVIVTYRPKRQGGRFEGNESDRLKILAAAAALGAEYIDVELDIPPADRPKGPTILSHHDFTGSPANLEEIVAELEASQADICKIVFAANGPEDALAALAILQNATKPTIALAMGEAGLASRILAGKFGAFGTFASLSEGNESAPGQLTIARMKNLYRWDSVGPATEVYGVIGSPVAHSMSPAIHNAAFAETDIDAVYVPLLIEPGAGNFNRFMEAVAPWTDLRGLSVTIPHKENAIARVGAEKIDELSRQIGAINTIAITSDGSLSGTNTDYAAAIDALCATMGIKREDLSGRRVAVIGAGGVARALVAALAHYNAETTIYNRTFTRAEKLAGEFGAKAQPLDEVSQISSEIIINCTSVGMHPNVNDTPVTTDTLARVKVVFDTIYNPIQTRLLTEAADAGCLTVSGVDMFVNQAAAQFEFWTDKSAPRDLMREVVVRHLTGQEK